MLPPLFTRLDEVDLDGINCDVSMKEIKNSLFSIGGLTTPGPDGFPALFYQRFWDICSNEISSFIQDCFQTTSFPNQLNATLITLVPKVERPISMA